LPVLEKGNTVSLAAGAEEASPGSSDHVPSKSRQLGLFDLVNRRLRGFDCSANTQ